MSPLEQNRKKYRGPDRVLAVSHVSHHKGEIRFRLDRGNHSRTYTRPPSPRDLQLKRLPDYCFPFCVKGLLRSPRSPTKIRTTFVNQYRITKRRWKESVTQFLIRLLFVDLPLVRVSVVPKSQTSTFGSISTGKRWWFVRPYENINN